MRYRLRTLLILLAVLPPVVGTITPPLLRWLRPDPTDELMELILSTRVPPNWADVGGPGSIHGFDVSCIAIISDKDTASEEISESKP